MERESLRVRAAGLVQKSRRALRLYTSIGRKGRGGESELSELQLIEWRTVNTEIIDTLAPLVEIDRVHDLANEISILADQFRVRWRATQSELHDGQRRLVTTAERGDFIKAAQLSELLVSLKARVQACHAAYYEVNAISSRSEGEIIEPQPEVTLAGSEEVAPSSAKVIPLRRGGVR